jgi:hypothetical protein
MCLPSAARSAAQNVELGSPLILPAAFAGNDAELMLEGPVHDAYRVPRTEKPSPQFAFTGATSPGVYTWHRVGNAEPIAMSLVSLPSAESDLTYRKASEIAPQGDDVVVVRSMNELRAKVSQLAEPQPQWTGPIAMVLLLLCFEALMGNVTRSRGAAAPVSVSV